MKIVVIEPLAVEEKRFLEIARAAVGQEHEIDAMIHARRM